MTVLGRSPFDIAADLLDPPEPDPVGWASNRCQIDLWSRQREILTAIRDHRRVAVKSCHDSGKSFTAAAAAAWWLDTHIPGEAFVVSTAPRWAQVRAILWREIGKLHRRAGLVGRVNQTEWHIGSEIVGFGRKPADTDDSGFQGIHAPHILVILDEAGGLPTSMWTNAETLLTNEGAHVLAIGNPDIPGTQFEACFRPGSGWHTVTIKAWDTPNFTGEQVPHNVRQALLSRVWVEEKRQQWGEGSPLWTSKIEAEFPLDASDGVVPWSWLARATSTERALHPSEVVPVELGIDVGGSDDGDLTVIRERTGIKGGRCWTTQSGDPENVVGLAMRCIRETECTAVKVDAIGIGWGVAGWIKKEIARDPELRARRVRVYPVNVAEAPSDRTKYANLRAELWWEIGRELTRTAGWDLSTMEASDDTLADLTAPKFSLDASGRIKIEPKDETRKRIGHSPDHADALLLAYAKPNQRDRRLVTT